MRFSAPDHQAPSTAQIVAAILFAVLLAGAVIVARLWLWNETFVYRGNGTPSSMNPFESPQTEPPQVAHGQL